MLAQEKILLGFPMGSHRNPKWDSARISPGWNYGIPVGNPDWDSNPVWIPGNPTWDSQPFQLGLPIIPAGIPGNPNSPDRDSCSARNPSYMDIPKCLSHDLMTVDIYMFLEFKKEHKMTLYITQHMTEYRNYHANMLVEVLMDQTLRTRLCHHILCISCLNSYLKYSFTCGSLDIIITNTASHHCMLNR